MINLQKVGWDYAVAKWAPILPELTTLSGVLWEYVTSDSVAVVQSPGYFDKGAFQGMTIGDIIILRQVSSEELTILVVTGITADNDATASKLVAANTPRLVTQSYVPSTKTSDGVNDTTYTTLASIIVPGGIMNPNGELIITQDWEYGLAGGGSSPSTKLLAMNWNGLQVSAPSSTTTIRANYRIAIKNLNSLSSQSIFGAANFGTASGNPVSSANTANDVVIDHTCRWTALLAAGAETITLLGYSIWYYPGSV